MCKQFSNVEFWDYKKQLDYIKNNWGSLDKYNKIMPEKDVRRRNFGFLRALELGSDYIISLDDDNYPGQNWLKDIKHVMEPKHVFMDSKLKVFNPCDALTEEHNRRFYSRGYPFKLWFKKDTQIQYADALPKKVMLHQMLWTFKPDIDSISNIVYPDLKPVSYRFPYNFVMEKDNYFPIDTQSIIFSKELSVFNAIYQEPMFGLPSHRYDDIWAGLFCQKLMHSMGDTCSFGSPIMEHRRNTHDFSKDLQTEFVGMILNQQMWNHIMSMEIKSKTYKDGFLEIADSLPEAFCDSQNEVVGFMKNIKDSMYVWVDALDKIGV